MENLSIVIPAFNEEAYLPDTLRSLHAAMENFHAQTGHRAQIIVVDNQSTDQTQMIAREFGCLVVTHREHNIAAVRNKGILEAKHNLVVTIDADCKVPPEALIEVAHLMKTDSYIGGALGVKFMARTRLHKLMAWIIQTLVFTFSGIQGSFLCFRKDVAETIGGFPEDRLFAEDVAFGRKLKKHAKQTHRIFGDFTHIEIETLDRKDIHVRDLLGILRHEWCKLLGGRPQTSDLDFWYSDKRRDSEQDRNQ